MKKLFEKYFLTILYFSSSIFQGLTAQNRVIDSLFSVLRSAKEDTAKVNALNTLAWQLKGMNPDTSLLLSKQALLLSEKLNWNIGLSRSYQCLGEFNWRTGNYNSALDFFSRSIDVYNAMEKNSNDKKLITQIQLEKADVYSNMGIVYDTKSEFNRALQYYFKALKVNETLNSKSGIAMQYCNIGIVYEEQKDFNRALECYLKSLKIAEEINEQEGIAYNLGNIGNVYRNLGDRQKAKEYYLKAIELNKKIGNERGIAVNIGCIGNIYAVRYDSAVSAGAIALSLSFAAEALSNYKKAYAISEELGDKENSALWLNNLGKFCLKRKKNKEAGDYLNKALPLANELHFLDLIKEVNQNLSELYAATGDYEQALKYYKLFVIVRDSVFSEESTKKIIQTQMQYDFDKKSVADSIKNSEAKKFEAINHQTEIQNQKLFTYAGVSGFLVMIVVAGISLNAFRNKKKANVLIAHQKMLVEEKQKEILDSIRYAKRIQNALLTSEKYIGRILFELNEK